MLLNFITAALLSTASSSFDQDREAILGMCGAFEVTFQFEEMTPVQADYKLKRPYEETAIEWVQLVEDRGDFISLQHILVADEDTGYVVKHWRQDWQFEDGRMMEFCGNNTWREAKSSPRQAAGRWTQAVYQTTDSPRYEAFGEWQHIGEHSEWISDRTWRPLPRREYTKRSDYHVLESINTHTVTPEGWVHEQSSRKVILDDAGQPKEIIVHERGLNSYVRVEEDRLSAAIEYWQEHESAWAEIRAAWEPILNQTEVTIVTEAGGKKLPRVITAALKNQSQRASLGEALVAFIEQ